MKKTLTALCILFTMGAYACIRPGPIGPDTPGDPPSPPVLQEVLIAEKTMSVRESDSDVDTLLDVLTTDRLVVNVSGTIWSGVWLTGSNGPQGWNNITDDLKFPLPGTHPYCMLAKIGVDYFFVGDGSQINHAPVNGRLLLRINDDVPGNGSGAFTASIQQYRKQ